MYNDGAPFEYKYFHLWWRGTIYGSCKQGGSQQLRKFVTLYSVNLYHLYMDKVILYFISTLLCWLYLNYFLQCISIYMLLTLEISSQNSVFLCHLGRFGCVYVTCSLPKSVNFVSDLIDLLKVILIHLYISCLLSCHRIDCWPFISKIMFKRSLQPLSDEAFNFRPWCCCSSSSRCT
jgi:hypothetical protein